MQKNKKWLPTHVFNLKYDLICHLTVKICHLSSLILTYADKSRIEEKNILEVPEEKNQTNSCEGMSNTNKKEDKKSKV